MNNVISYSGISAKVRAMQSELLREEDFRKLAEIRLPIQKAEFLSGFKPYAELFRNVGEVDLHRMGLERRLWLSVYRDYDKLFRFANAQQRAFLQLYFAHFEVSMVRECLQSVLSGNPQRFRFTLYESYIHKYARIDLIRLAQCKSIEEFIEALSGTAYYSILKRLFDSGKATAVDYETAINMRYFSTMWRMKGKVLTKREEETIEKTFGCEIDLLNMSWIHRAKKYFAVQAEELYSLLIPIRYRLTADEIRRMAEAGSMEEFLEIERSTRYGAKVMGYIEQGLSTGAAFTELVDHIYRSEARKSPYSVAPLHTYFHLKEKEISRIIYTVESTHYQGDAPEKAVGEVSL